jgi:two-component system, OmpR family, alkaline phosphatase synthesis response regulator PhoP
VDKQAVLHHHGISIHPGRRIIRINGQSVDLTYTEFQILYYLAGKPGWVFTRNQIVDAVRGDNYSVTDRSVDVQMVGLRKKLGSYGKYLETVRNVDIDSRNESINLSYAISLTK